MRVTVLTCGVLTCAAGALVAAAQAGQTTPLSVSLKPGTAFILGRVVEAGGATGVSSAVVTLTGPALGAGNTKFANGTPGGPRRAFVDAQGQFLFRDLPVGVYNLSATAAGFIDGAYGQTQPARRPLDLVRSLEITQSDTRVNAAIPMWRTGGISGRVTDEAGEPMVGAPITLLARTADWGAPVIRMTANVTTDDRGTYHADVPPGDYLVGLIAATTTFPVSAAEGFLQAQREGGATMQAYMNEVVASGSLLPRGVGSRVGNLMVSQFGMRNAWVVPPFTIRDGRLSFYPTTFHPSSMTGASASVVTVASGEEKTGIDVQLRPAPARHVAGRVVGPNGPVGNIAVRFIAPNTTVTGSQTITNDTPQALADGNGEFTLLGVSPGSYTVRVLREPRSDAESALWAVEQVTIGADTDVTDLQIRLQTGATIGGRVAVEGAGPPPAPAALRAITVRPLPVPGSDASFMGVLLNWVVRPDENTRFRTRQVVPGPHMIVVSNVPSGWTLKSVTAGGKDAGDRPFDVPMSGVDDLVVTITQRVSTLAGVVRDANGQPAPWAAVAVFPADTANWPPPGIASRRIQTLAPARDGAYAFRSLPAGEYFVVASDGAADFSDARARTASISGASRVTIIDGNRTMQDLRVVAKR